MNSTVHRVALVDDEQNVHLAVAHMLAAANADWKLETHLDGASALQKLPGDLPDAVLMDIRMPGLSGIECTRWLKALLPQLPVTMHTASEDHETILASLMAGASGYLVKPQSAADLVNALNSVARGGNALCEQAQTAVLACLKRADAMGLAGNLTARERQIMTCLAQNLVDKEIAERLNISNHTVHVHLRRIYRKLGVSGWKAAVRKFLGMT